MQSISRAYTWLITALAVISAAMLGLITLMIVVDVTIRNLGYQPYPHTLALTEYSLLYITMLGAPWLTRHKGHVHIELVVGRLHGVARQVGHAFVCLVCVGVCAMLAWYSLDVTLGNLTHGEMDVRSFDAPRWILVACMPVGFGLSAVEFARFLFGYGDMFEESSVFE